MGRVASVYNIHLRSQKKLSSADLVVAVSPTADGQIAIPKTDPNQTHPFSATALLATVNERRAGRRLTIHDHHGLCRQDKLRDNPKYAWKHSNGASLVWSGEAVAYMASLTDEQYDAARAGYRESLRAGAG